MDTAGNPLMLQEGGTAYHGELVVQNGQWAGARRPLKPAPTLLGRGDGCDIRLKAAGVADYHCVLVLSPSGLLLRDLGSGSGTILNGDLVVAATLRDGDLLTVGPFRFRVSLTGAVPSVPPGSSNSLYDPATLEQERDALRVQVAVLAAQQAGLTEQESRLQQRDLALNKQEAQLAAHFEQRKKEIAGLQEQVRNERMALRLEREDYEQKGGEALQLLEKEKQRLEGAQAQLEKRRRRLASLAHNLKQRRRKHWDLERVRIEKREQYLNAERKRLDRQAEALVKEREGIVQFRLRSNGEIELARRRQEAQCEELVKERQLHAQSRAELQQQLLQLDRRNQDLLELQTAIDREAGRSQRARINLEREVHGLETRVSNLRVKLVETEQRLHAAEPARATASAAEGEGAASPASALARPIQAEAMDNKLGVLEKFAGELADQRRLLVEECVGLLQIEEIWQEQHRTAEEALQAIVDQIQQREQALLDEEQAQLESGRGLLLRWDELGLRETRLEAWQSRLVARATNAEGEEQRLLEKVRAREAMADHQLAALEDLREQWLVARRVERARVTAEFQQAGEMRARYARLWEECQEKLAAVHEAQKAVAERTLAIEQYRLELTADAADTVAAERHLELLQRQQGNALSAAARKVEHERQALLEEGKRLERLCQDVEKKQRELDAREQEFLQRRTHWEQQQRSGEITEAKLQESLKSLHLQRRHLERQIDELNAELERIINTLLCDGLGNQAALAQAA